MTRARARRSRSAFAYAVAQRWNMPARLHQIAFRRELAILMYHGVVRDHPLPFADWCFIGADQFEAEMRYLERHLEVLPLNTAVEHMREGRLRRPTAVVTFDDGFQSVHDVAFPILKDLSLPATVFLATSFIDTRNTVWFCELIQILAATQMEMLTWRDQNYDVSHDDARARTSARLQRILKEMHPHALDTALREIALALSVDIEAATDAHSPFRMLDGAAIKRMVDSGLIEFGAHTESHAVLTRVEPDRARSEISGSIARTAELTGVPCRSFAYPNGRRQDYDDVALAALRDADISTAVTTMAGPNTAHSPRLELRRYGIGPGGPLGRFQLDVHHLRAHLGRS